MRKILYFLGVIAIGFAFLLLAYFCYLLFYPFRVIEVKQPLRIVTKEVRPGGNLEYIVDYCKYGDYAATVVRTITCVGKDDVLSSPINFPVSGTVTLPGCRQTHVIIPIPLSAKPGICTLYTKPTYQVNPVRQIGITSQSEPFQIIK